MFNKLRFKLTLTNVIVVSVIFIIFVMSIFIVMSKLVNDQTEQLVNLIASNEGVSNLSDNISRNKHDEHQYRYFSVRLDSTGKVISASSNLNLRNSPQMSEIISKAFSVNESRGIVSSDEETYQFLRSSVNGIDEIYMAFVNTHEEHEMLNMLLIVLVFAGLGGLVLVFFGSLYMANRSLIPIKEAWNRQKAFVADASHELRTPLSVIETTLDLLSNRREKTIASQIKWLENIQTENKRMTKLVSDLLLLARADSDQDTLELQTFPLHTSLLEAYIPFEAIALQKGIHLQAFNGESFDFYGDESKIKQLAVILVDNGIKYTPAGGTVGMTLKDIGDSVEICVTDSGEGISEEHINKIFQRFYRVDKSRSRREGSVGLGLSIAEWIVNQHGGHIEVESIKGKGSTFHIYLPKQK